MSEKGGNGDVSPRLLNVKVLKYSIVLDAIFLEFIVSSNDTLQVLYDLY